MGRLADGQFGNGVARPDSGHNLAPPSFVDYVRHPRPRCFPAIRLSWHPSAVGRELTTTETVALSSDFAPNRTPAAASAALIRSRVATRTAKPASTRAMVFLPTLASRASRPALHPRPARAMRISTAKPVIGGWSTIMWVILHHFVSHVYG